jgi:DNA-directed RNA polymerase subunit M/transcription elongation factor TFIIS
MEFCEFCENMLYIKDADDDSFNVKYYCKNCHFEKPLSIDNTSTLIIQNKYLANVNFKNVVNKNIIHDPTIPHIDNIPCPNTECCKPIEKSNDIIYIKVDNINLKFIYYCVYCKEFWENKI